MFSQNLIENSLTPQSAKNESKLHGIITISISIKIPRKCSIKFQSRVLLTQALSEKILFLIVFNERKT